MKIPKKISLISAVSVGLALFFSMTPFYDVSAEETTVTPTPSGAVKDENRGIYARTVSIREEEISKNGLAGITVVTPTPLPGISKALTDLPDFKDGFDSSKQDSEYDRVDYVETEDGVYRITYKYTVIDKNDLDENSHLRSDRSYETIVHVLDREIWKSMGGVLEKHVADVNSRYTVYHYTEGKHLAGRSHSVTGTYNGYSAFINYGNIVNTDGSLNYTTGDYLGYFGNGDNGTFYLNFSITPDSMFY